MSNPRRRCNDNWTVHLSSGIWDLGFGIWVFLFTDVTAYEYRFWKNWADWNKSQLSWLSLYTCRLQNTGFITDFFRNQNKSVVKSVSHPKKLSVILKIRTILVRNYHPEWISICYLCDKTSTNFSRSQLLKSRSQIPDERWTVQ